MGVDIIWISDGNIMATIREQAIKEKLQVLWPAQAIRVADVTKFNKSAMQLVYKNDDLM